MDTSNTSFWLALKFGFILIGEWIRLHSNWLSNWACFWLALKLSFILIGWDCHFVSQISTFMKWLFFDKCEKVKLLPHQRNIYFYRLKFPIQKLDNILDLGYFRKTFEADHQPIVSNLISQPYRSSGTCHSSADITVSIRVQILVWSRGKSGGENWLMI